MLALILQNVHDGLLSSKILQTGDTGTLQQYTKHRSNPKCKFNKNIFPSQNIFP